MSPIGERIGISTVESPASDMIKKLPICPIRYIIKAVNTPEALFNNCADACIIVSIVPELSRIKAIALAKPTTNTPPTTP